MKDIIKSTFYVMVFVVIVVVGVDCFWTIKTAQTILENEQNPIARLIITYGNGVSLLVFLKIINTLFVVYLLYRFYIIDKFRSKTFLTTFGIFIFHCWLLYYLFFGHQLPY